MTDIERSRTIEFVLLWWLWLGRFMDDFSDGLPPDGSYPHQGVGYRAGQVWPRGAHRGDHTNDWNAFFNDVGVANNLSTVMIDALYCYRRYASCRTFIDTGGKQYVP
jgi:hypothetical protein